MRKRANRKLIFRIRRDEHLNLQRIANLGQPEPTEGIVLRQRYSRRYRQSLDSKGVSGMTKFSPSFKIKELPWKILAKS